jgi:hypothetical protein
MTTFVTEIVNEGNKTTALFEFSDQEQAFKFATDVNAAFVKNGVEGVVGTYRKAEVTEMPSRAEEIRPFRE